MAGTKKVTKKVLTFLDDNGNLKFNSTSEADIPEGWEDSQPGNKIHDIEDMPPHFQWLEASAAVAEVVCPEIDWSNPSAQEVDKMVEAYSDYWDSSTTIRYNPRRGWRLFRPERTGDNFFKTEIMWNHFKDRLKEMCGDDKAVKDSLWREFHGLVEGVSDYANMLQIFESVLSGRQ